LASVPSDQRFCGACGSDLSETPTGTAPRPTPHRPGSDTRRTATPSSATGVAGAAGGRFSPGDVLVERYRVVGLVGKGGMGEVYRADDLKLEQPVALKFLPEDLERDRDRLERFYGEVRIARQVSHPAVCRVHDIGDVDGAHFLSMEFVDGENLASLLRRIGRLPADKARDIARQLCAGLAAAHEKGVLHRDLKPDNVMIDGRGRVRITDFGLAGLAESFAGEELRSGTPAYMAPEQIAGDEVSPRSDVFALGLVLYELYTGRKAYTGRSLAEIARKQREEPPPDPSVLVPDIDPAVERAILLCLERDPARRPPSALAVAALLEGRDLLEALLAAGETPSAELVAAASVGQRLPAWGGWACLAAIVAGLLLWPLFARSLQIVHRVPMERAPAALDDRARDLLRRLGETQAPADSSGGFQSDEDLRRWAREHDPELLRGLRTGDPVLLTYWYRQAPRPLVSREGGGRVGWASPPFDQSGMAGVRYDMKGRLRSFYRVPPQLEEPPVAPIGEPDFGPLLAETGLDLSSLRAVEPRWTPPFFCDRRLAWETELPGRPALPLRIEAGSYRGRPVVFYLVSPWTRAERMQPFVITDQDRFNLVLFVGILICLLVAGVVLARRNLGLGRGDRRGAARLAGAMLVVGSLDWLLGADHVLEWEELTLIGRGMGSVLLLAAVIWLFYIALEPYVRRLKPHTLVGWTRLLGGSWRDPLVARDVLLGVTWGCVLGVLMPLTRLVPTWLGGEEPEAWGGLLDTLLSLRYLLGRLMESANDSVVPATCGMLLFLVLRLVLRREAWATAVLVAVLSVFQAAELRTSFWLALPMALLIMGSFVALLLRCGLLAGVVGVFVLKLLLNLPVLSPLAGWGGGPTPFVIAIVALLSWHGLRHGVSRSVPVAA
jgi:serine/threonine-protein kinase